MALMASVPGRQTIREEANAHVVRAQTARPMRLTVLGATGSVGSSTLDLVERAPERFEIVALTAQSNARALAALAIGTGRAQLSGIGVLYSALPVVALGWLRGDEPLGFLATIFVLLSVVVTDVAAYAAGRTIGGPKLWPKVSPNKTWSGLIGAVVAASIAGALFSWLSGTGSAQWLASLGGVLAIIAQGGDLAESALKRHFGVKDSGDLIPGHGGVMDRMDGIVTASIAAALIAFAIDAYAPARALLYGS
jgi:phosphatidate cytidylyltransferase